jgi:hypothetical protein
MKGLMMAHKARIDRPLFCSLKKRHVLIVAIVASAALNAGQSAAQAPTISLTKVGSPIWRPADIQVFSAPDDLTTNAFLRGPNDPPREATTYTTPHGPPYDSELSTNMAAAGFVSRSVFPREAIAHNPNAIHRALMVLPDPGITGSSRDFASGPIIPSSLFPFTSSREVWRNGALAATGGGQVAPVRPTDLPFEGMSHRLTFDWYWNTGANNFGNYEMRSSLRDTEGNGWDIVAPFKIVRAGDFDEDGDVDAADLPRWTVGFGASSGALHAEGDADFDGDADGTDFLAWQRELGQTLALAAAESTVPEPSTFILAGAGLIAWTLARRRRTA